jgi:ceramide glucosyltransferase
MSVSASIIVLVVSTLWIFAGVGALIVSLQATTTPTLGRSGPAVTVLKPLAGADEALFENLRSFFEQRGVDFEILFGVARANDPAIAVVEALQKAYPHVRSRLVVHQGSRGSNPKVSNLKRMIEHASHDLVLISDSSVRAPVGYLAEAVRVLLDRGAGLVTHVFAGVGERSIGAALENVQLCGFTAAGIALPTMLGEAAVVGKSMLFSRDELERLGGLESVSDVLAEDFLIGKMFQHAGREVVIAPTIISSVNGQVRIDAFMDRQLRWSMMRMRLHPIAFLLEPLTNPIAMLPLALWVVGPLGFLWAASLIILRDVGQWLLLRGPKRVALAVVLGPARDLLMLGVWLVTPFKKHVSWRGHRVRLGTGTRVFISEPGRAEGVG